MRPLFLLCLPLPPPYSGEETLGLTIRSAFAELNPTAYQLAYFDISSKHSNQQRGKLGFRNVWAFVRLFFRFLAVLWKKRPQIVYVGLAQNVWGFAKYSLFIRAARCFRCRVLSSLGGANFDLFFSRVSLLWQKWIRSTLGQIELLMVQGESLKNQFNGLVEPNRIRAVHLGLDPKPFIAHGSPTGHKNSIDVLFVGCFSKAKGVLDLLEAVPLAAKEVPNIHFHLVGEWIERERNILHIANPENNREVLDRLCKKPEIRSYLTLHGVLIGEAKLKLFRQADIFVLPSYSESFPFVLLEACAAGLPLVTTPVGANLEVYREGDNAFYVQPGDVGNLSKKLIELANNPSLRERMGQNNVRLIRQNFTHIHFGKRLDLVFQEVRSSLDFQPIVALGGGGR